MATNDQDIMNQLVNAIFGAMGVLSAASFAQQLATMASMSHNAVQHNANAATLDLATTANSVMLVLGGQPVKPANTNDVVDDVVTTSRVYADLPPGAPVVT